MRSPAILLAAGAAVLCVAILASEDGGGAGVFYPTCRPGKVTHNYVADIPREWQQRNYSGGSCVWASASSMLRGIGDFRSADWIARNRRGGASSYSLHRTFNQLGVPYAYTKDGDIRLLEWAAENNRSCVIGYGAYHAQTFVGKKDGYAIILNNNGPKTYRVEWNQFVRRWRSNRPEPGWATVAIPKNVVPPPEVPFHQGA